MGHPAYNKGKGRAMAWLRANVGHVGDGCLTWPFGLRSNGYGSMGYEGKIFYAHRMMCKLAHGEPPTPDHEAAHSCGKGHLACVHPQHLSWKTASENHLDRRRHGTHVTSTSGSWGKISAADKMEILALKGKLPQRVIAAKFGVHFETISRIHRTDPNKQYVHHAWWPEEDAELTRLLAAGESVKQIAVKMGRTQGSVDGRMRRLRRAPQERS